MGDLAHITPGGVHDKDLVASIDHACVGNTVSLGRPTRFSILPALEGKTPYPAIRKFHAIDLGRSAPIRDKDQGMAVWRPVC